jgi:hypothetical protein
LVTSLCSCGAASAHHGRRRGGEVLAEEARGRVLGLGDDSLHEPAGSGRAAPVPAAVGVVGRIAP